MAVEKVISEWAAPAAADLSSDQYKVVKFDANDELVLAGAGDAGFVLQDKPTAGQHGTIALAGVSKVELGGTVAAGDYLSSNASGLAVKATDGTAAVDGTKIIGQALAKGVSGDLISAVVASGLA